MLGVETVSCRIDEQNIFHTSISILHENESILGLGTQQHNLTCYLSPVSLSSFGTLCITVLLWCLEIRPKEPDSLRRKKGWAFALALPE